MSAASSSHPAAPTLRACTPQAGASWGAQEHVDPGCTPRHAHMSGNMPCTERCMLPRVCASRFQARLPEVTQLTPTDALAGTGLMPCQCA